MEKNHFVLCKDIDMWDTVLGSGKESMLKSRDITLPTKLRVVKAWFFQ